MKTKPNQNKMNEKLDEILKWQQAERNDAHRLELTPSSLHLLCLIARHEGEIMSYYSAAVGTTAAATTGMADFLSRQGYVTRETVVGDRRATALRLTERGSRAIRDMVTGGGK